MKECSLEANTTAGGRIRARSSISLMLPSTFTHEADATRQWACVITSLSLFLAFSVFFLLLQGVLDVMIITHTRTHTQIISRRVLRRMSRGCNIPLPPELFFFFLFLSWASSVSWPFLLEADKIQSADLSRDGATVAAATPALVAELILSQSAIMARVVVMVTHPPLMAIVKMGRPVVASCC